MPDCVGLCRRTGNGEPDCLRVCAEEEEVMSKIVAGLCRGTGNRLCVGLCSGTGSSESDCLWVCAEEEEAVSQIVCGFVQRKRKQ